MIAKDERRSLAKEVLVARSSLGRAAAHLKKLNSPLKHSSGRASGEEEPAGRAGKLRLLTRSKAWEFFFSAHSFARSCFLERGASPDFGSALGSARGRKLGAFCLANSALFVDSVSSSFTKANVVARRGSWLQGQELDVPTLGCDKSVEVHRV